MNDFSVCATWLTRKNRAWMLDLKREHLEFPELRRTTSSHAAGWSADLVLIERAGSGISLIQDLNRETKLNIVGIVPRADKATRLMNVSAIIEGGRVYLPKHAPWLAEFQHEITLFSNGRHDDHCVLSIGNAARDVFDLGSDSPFRTITSKRPPEAIQMMPDLSQ